MEYGDRFTWSDDFGRMHGIKKQEKWFAYLSSVPLSEATLPGPFRAIHCTMDKVPRSQGIRASTSTMSPTHRHIWKLMIGDFVKCVWVPT